MIKTVFVPLMVKAIPVGQPMQEAQRQLSKMTAAACDELDKALDDGYRIIAQQYIDSTHDSGTVFFIRDDADQFDITEAGLAALEAVDFENMDVSAPLVPEPWNKVGD